VAIRLRPRFFKLASIGQPCSKMLILMSELATVLKGPEIGQGRIQCLGHEFHGPFPILPREQIYLGRRGLCV